MSHIWDGTNIVADLEDGEITSVYVRGFELLYAQGGTGSLSYGWYVYNGHGDVTGLANAAGSLSRNYDYDAFGNQLEASQNASPDGNPFRYCGEYFDVETGFIYLRARYYDPAK